MIVAGIGLVATAFITKTGDAQSFRPPRLLEAFGWTYLTLGVVITILLTTGAAWLHQASIHRLTFMLFRLYATVISAGIGSVFGWCLCWWMLANEDTTRVSPLWILTMLTLISGFGVGAYKGARSLRGEAPAKLTWISPEEFAGS